VNQLTVLWDELKATLRRAETASEKLMEASVKKAASQNKVTSE
jgi:hypothetical protein